MRDIEARISDLIGRQNTLYAEMDEATENIRQGSSYVDDQLGKTKLKTDHLERQIELFGVEISSAQAVLNDTKNLYEVFRLFQNDVPE